MFGPFLKVTEFYLQIDTTQPTKVISISTGFVGVHACNNNKVKDNRFHTCILWENILIIIDYFSWDQLRSLT